MQIHAIKTPLIEPSKDNVLSVIDMALPTLQEKQIIVVTSKIVSLCEGRWVSTEVTNKESLIKQEADLVLPSSHSKYGHHFTITHNTLIAAAGIDESNSKNTYVLWPKDPQQTANSIRAHLMKKHSLQNLGIIISDSTCQPLRRGTTGIVLAYSGFQAINDYVGKKDLFGRPFGITQANVAGGLAAAAVMVMGEGSEQTPIAVIDDANFIVYKKENPGKSELAGYFTAIENDLFAPFLSSVPWQKP